MFHGPRLPFLGWTLERADALLAVTRELAATVRALVGRTDGVHHVPNGVDAALFRPDAAGALDELAGCPRPWLAFSGELRLKKGMPLLLDLAGRLAAEGRGTLVLLGGVRADERDGFARWRRGAGAAAARIREIAWTADPARRAAACAAMDAFVFPSLWDGMPNALLEAMAAARPVVASAVGGAPRSFATARAASSCRRTSSATSPPSRCERWTGRPTTSRGWARRRARGCARTSRWRPSATPRSACTRRSPPAAATDAAPARADMKILYLAPDPVPAPKGASVRIERTVATLRALGHDVELFTPPAGAAGPGNFLERVLRFRDAAGAWLAGRRADLVQFRSIWEGSPRSAGRGAPARRQCSRSTGCHRSRSSSRTTFPRWRARSGSSPRSSRRSAR